MFWISFVAQQWNTVKFYSFFEFLDNFIVRSCELYWRWFYLLVFTILLFWLMGFDWLVYVLTMTLQQVIYELLDLCCFVFRYQLMNHYLCLFYFIILFLYCFQYRFILLVLIAQAKQFIVFFVTSVVINVIYLCISMLWFGRRTVTIVTWYDKYQGRTRNNTEKHHEYYTLRPKLPYIFHT